MRKVLLAVACWATIGLASSQADVDYRYVSDLSNYTAAAGTQVTVSVFLQETVSGTSTSKIFADGGLFGAGVMVTRTGTGNGTIFVDTTFGTPGFSISANEAISPNGFGGLNTKGQTVPPTIEDPTPSTATQAGLIVNADAPNAALKNGGPIPASGGVGVNKILLGTLNIIAGTTPTTFQITPYGQKSSTITQKSTDLDFGTQATNGYNGASTPLAGLFSFSVGAAVPEPGSMALCGLIATGMSYAGYRRRKTTVVSEPATEA